MADDHEQPSLFDALPSWRPRPLDPRFELDDDDLPPLVSGVSPATRATSEAAADDIESSRAAQRRAVLEAIRAAGPSGCTDDELQRAMTLGGNSERPRRVELWNLQLIAPLRDATGAVVKRATTSGRAAVVWIAVTPDAAA